MARQQKRIGRVGADPILPIKAFFDIGGSGHNADAMAIWIAQFVGREIRLLDYIEGVGQCPETVSPELVGDRMLGARRPAEGSGESCLI